MAERHPHPKAFDLYTPITPELLDLLVRMRDELGSWREVSAVSGHRMRVIRRLYRLERKCVSQTLLDSLCSTVGVGHISEFPWFTADDLVALGIWSPVEFFGDVSHPDETPVERERRKIRGWRKARRARIAEKNRKRRMLRRKGIDPDYQDEDGGWKTSDD